jgi:hypothetical protein
MLKPRDYMDIPWADKEDDMVSVMVGVGGRRSAVGGEVNQSPRFSAFLIGLFR